MGGILKMPEECVSLEDAVPGRMRVKLGLGIAVVSSVYRSPPDRGAMKCKVCACDEEILKCFVAAKCPMSQQPVQPDRYTESVP